MHINAVGLLQYYLKCTIKNLGLDNFHILSIRVGWYTNCGDSMVFYKVSQYK